MTIDKSNQEPDETKPLAGQTEAKEAADDIILLPPRPREIVSTPTEASTETPTDDCVFRPPRPREVVSTPPDPSTDS